MNVFRMEISYDKSISYALRLPPRFIRMTHPNLSLRTGTSSSNSIGLPNQVWHHQNYSKRARTLHEDGGRAVERNILAWHRESGTEEPWVAKKWYERHCSAGFAAASDEPRGALDS